MANSVLATIFCFTLAACASTPPDAPMTAPVDVVADDASYVIGPTDQLTVFVWRQPELSSNAIVRPDGKISVPLIDDLQAAGSTPTALAGAISSRLSEYVHDPKVSVI